ncbi:type II secretion system protein [Kordiimonas sp.]|uniref:type II secretion system protein n=1 Tax=Kordiimonas sp. TaxID=1970157 RepID=UPI003A8D8D58
MKDLTKEEGFTLLEVVVALSVFAGAMAVLFPIFGALPQRSFVSEQRAIGFEISQALLEEQLAKKDWTALDSSSAIVGEEGAWKWEITAERYIGAPESEEDSGTFFELSVSASYLGEREIPPVLLKRIVWRQP